MKLSNPDAPLRLRRRARQRAEQAAQDIAQVVAPVEAELHLGQVPVRVVGELDRVVGAAQRCLDIAQECIDRAELGVAGAGFPSARNLAVVRGA